MTIMATAPIPEQHRLDSTTKNTRCGTEPNILDEAVTALGAFLPENRQDAEATLTWWRRRAEMSDADVTEVLDRLFPRDAIKPVTICPRWCVIELIGDTESDTLHVGNDHHVHATSPDGRDVSDIEISLEAGIKVPTTIRLQGAADAPMTPVQALELAHQLVLAAREAYGIPR